jgi:hypothetical protein
MTGPSKLYVPAHAGGGRKLEVPFWHLKFEVANCDLKILALFLALKWER